MMNPKVTIITQAYNEEQYIERCIQSVLEQTYPNFDLLLIDDGSQDRTGTIMDGYAEKDDRIRVIHNEENQLYAFWIKHLKELILGEFFVSLDADDWLELTFLEECIKTAKEDDADIVCTLSYFHYPDGQVERISQFQAREVLTREKVVERFQAFTCMETIWAKMVSTELILAADYTLVQKNIDTCSDYGLDAAILWACIEKAQRVSWLSEYLYHYNADHDITFHGYHRRLPYFVRSFPVNLEQEYQLLCHWGKADTKRVDIVFEEYLLKMNACIESCFSDSFFEDEQLERIARVFAADIGSVRPAILTQQCGTYAHILETASTVLDRVDDPGERKWLEVFLSNKEMRESVIFALLVIKYLQHWKRRLTAEKEGREHTISELETDRAEKDAHLVEYEKIIEDLTRARDEKEKALQEAVQTRDEEEAALQETIQARDEKEAALQEAVRARDEKEKALQEAILVRDEKEVVIQELIRVRDEKEAALQETVQARDEKERYIEELLREREAKDQVIAERERSIVELIQVRDEKDAELDRREALLEEYREQLEHENGGT